MKKYEYNIQGHIIFSVLSLGLIFVSYNTLYKSQSIYDNLGDTSLTDVWITTCQYQIRGLVYPFVYTNRDVIDEKLLDPWWD